MVIYTIALAIHVIICVALVLVILAQTSKGGLDANLGGAAMNVFGGSGASKFLRQWTQILGIVFIASCIFLAFQVKASNKSSAPKILQEKFGETAKPAAAKSAPAKTTDQAKK
ncbi:MAG TPA: preprotein translocase subunit SecG [Candidatus Syntrophosphaera sp.]|jgi:preprotein translocase subunit SecG|nr:preprotein translocase subunit SecG [Candidatus Syntrophosphaera sp.]